MSPNYTNAILAIFAKQPVRGQAKTRLARDTSDDFAERVASAMLEDTLDRFAGVQVRRIIVYTPTDSAAYFERIAAGRYELHPQGDGDLGQRLCAFFAFARSQGSTRTVVIGADSPTLPIEHIANAFRDLETDDVVLGATLDGGYYLLGMGTRELPIFDGIPWSSTQVFDLTMKRIPAGARLSLSPPWYDVDTLDDWTMLCSQVVMMRAAGKDPGVPRCEQLVKEFMQ